MPTYIKWPELVGGARVEYAPEILERLRLLAIDGLFALPKVGMAIGGLLTGSADLGKVRVSGAIEIPCSHAVGPSFVLTGAELSRACALAFGEGKQQVVGWYCSKPRGELALDAQQAALFAEICPEPWQIGLLIKPSTVEATTARICARTGESEYTPGQPMDLIEYSPPVRQVVAEVVESEVMPPAPSMEAVPEPAVPLVQTFKVPVFVEPEPARSKRLFVLSALAGVVFLFILYTYRWSFVPRPPLEVSVVEESGQVTVRWNPEALQGIEEGSIALNDGGQLQTIRLDQRVLISGWIRTPRKSDRVTAKLTAGEVSGLGAWVAPTAQPVPAPAAVAPPPGSAR